MEYHKDESACGVREKIIEIIHAARDEALMELIGKAVSGCDQKCSQCRPVLQLQNHLLVIKRSPAQERQHKKDDGVGNLVGAYRKFETWNLLE